MRTKAIDWTAALARLEVAVDTLASRHVAPGFALDRELAGAALDHVARYAAEGVPPGPYLEPSDRLLAFAIRHGVSLDWLLIGDVRGMICKAAAAT